MNLRNNQKTSPVSGDESARISRNILTWLNKNTIFPPGIKSFDFEYLDADKPCMALSSVQGAEKIKQYITGGYMARYPFMLIYRGQPDGNNERLNMDEVLNDIALSAVKRAEQTRPYIGDGLNVQSLSCDALSTMVARYANGDENHQVLMTMTYERMN